MRTEPPGSTQRIWSSSLTINTFRVHERNPKIRWRRLRGTSATISSRACGVSLDGNFWYGGKTSLNGVPNPKAKQTNSRIGATAAVPISKHQSPKISYNNGAYINYGGNY